MGNLDDKIREALSNVSIDCDYRLTAKDWHCIEIFQLRAKEFIEERKALNLGLLSIQMSRQPDGSISGRGNIPTTRQLKIFYLAFRFFYLEKEPSNFNKVVNIAYRVITDPVIRILLRRSKEQWKGRFIQTISEFHGRKYTTKQVVDAWFNANIFHSDEKHKKGLAEIDKLLKDELSRIALFMCVWDAGLAVSSLYKLIENLGPSHGHIAIPKHIYDSVTKQLDTNKL